MKPQKKLGLIYVFFQNQGDTIVLVPNLRYRIGEDKISLYSRYFYYNSDTMFITLSSYVNDGLYKIKYDARVKSGNAKILYVDEELRPGLTFTTKVRVDSIRPVRILMLQFNDMYWVNEIN